LASAFSLAHGSTSIINVIPQTGLHLMPLSMVTKANGTSLHLWSSQDALVLKMLAMSLPDALSLSPLCTHIKGHGGLKATVNDVHAALPDLPT
jgi:hypothetical protein